MLNLSRVTLMMSRKEQFAVENARSNNAEKFTSGQ